MPPRFAYWTILAGGLPTSFRAADRDDLLPTFRRIKARHPDAEMKYFARGKLWESADEARRAHAGRFAATPRPDVRDRRGRGWRPGGEHRDPRQPFKDAKKTRNQDRRRQRWQRTAASRGRLERNPQPSPARPPGPNREPPPGREPKPEPPPRPSEPAIKPPGPPERGRKRFEKRRRKE